MPKFGVNLDTLFNYSDKTLSKKNIAYLCLRLIEILEIVHNSGYIYGDLKLDNIMFGNG